jgi:hypothetical protein
VFLRAECHVRMCSIVARHSRKAEGKFSYEHETPGSVEYKRLKIIAETNKFHAASRTICVRIVSMYAYASLPQLRAYLYDCLDLSMKKLWAAIEPDIKDTLKEECAACWRQFLKSYDLTDPDVSRVVAHNHIRPPWPFAHAHAYALIFNT